MGFKKILNNERGIALVMVLVLSIIALAIMSGLIYIITSGTQISGIQKRYKTALEAGVGGADVAYQFVAVRGNPNIPNINFAWSSSFTNPCLTAKLTTTAWTTNWAACNNYTKATSISIDPNDPDTYDATFDLGASPYPTYRVYTKIVDTVEGNSGGEEGLLKGSVVSTNSGEVTVQSKPYLYTIEIKSENTANTGERAKFSILYQY